MKSRRNNSNKAEKQMFEAKIVINYNSLETGCDVCLQRETELKIDRKTILKRQSSKTQNCF